MARGDEITTLQLYVEAFIEVCQLIFIFNFFIRKCSFTSLVNIPSSFRCDMFTPFDVLIYCMFC